MKISREVTTEELLGYQKNEITEHYIYKALSTRVDGLRNRRILSQIADDELRHYNTWKSLTRQDVAPGKFRIWFYTVLSSLLGVTFSLKLMEKAEKSASELYERLPRGFNGAEAIVRDEEEHEQALLSMFDEERLKYTGSIVLGLNDALVELMGVLAGLTFALQDTRYVAMTGVITGFAAALSMAASEYLSTKTEAGGKQPLRAALYTGIAYLFTVVVLVAPYLLLSSIYVALAVSFAGAVLIIGVFNFYVSVAQGTGFRNRFLEMVGLSFGVATLSFLAGMAARVLFGIDV
ncbi:VIT1/CCC1 transporter family protein [Prosthecochloris sp. HL-130-GSB]|nr:VIT1/CCC1 transporter family protein [Prosthecochloris sp. HL-130-GSB]ARM31031.1 rubrerythrin family protein [Prosthecochloris sp. HL-130-GSB]MBO8092165.1 VIT1/CCC1 transporter family protein [Prosthecochloris sp.]